MTQEQQEQLVERHKRFWAHTLDEPLVGRRDTVVWKPRPYPLRDRQVVDPTAIQPEDLDIERFIGLRGGEDHWRLGDLICSAGCAYPQAWMGSLVGCRILVSAFGCVAKPTGADLPTICREFTVEAAMASPWAELMDGVLLRADECFGGRCPVRQHHMRGVIDMLAACLGEEQLCMAPYDHPEELAQLAARFAELYVATAKRGIRRRRLWNDGHVSAWRIYLPGPAVDYQIDASSLLAPQTYREHFLAHDRAVLREFPYSFIHLHACGLHILDVVLEIDELKAVQIQLDRETGVWEKGRILDCCRRVQERRKGLIVCGMLTESELEEFKSALRPDALALYYWNP